MMLQVTDLAKYYNGQPVFSGFNLHLPAGRFQVLLGPSGCGKTTLFNTLTGVTPKDGGTITWQGETAPHLGNLCAYMHQKDLLLPWFSLMENALLPVRTRGGIWKPPGTGQDSYLSAWDLGGMNPIGRTRYPGACASGAPWSGP